MAKIPHLILAAGASSRMGQPKQLLPWGGQTLIEHQIQIRLQTGEEVVVVLGANSKIILPIIEKLPIIIIINPEWALGIGNSLAFGIRELNNKIPDAKGALISLVDQPLITIIHLNKLFKTCVPGNQQIIASQSASGWTGVPALFDRFYFEELIKLNGEEGARKIIKKFASNVIPIDARDLLEDMDTPESYQYLLKRFYKK